VCFVDDEVETDVEGEDDDDDYPAWDEVDEEPDGVTCEPAPSTYVAISHDSETYSCPEEREKPRDDPDDEFVFLNPA